MHVNDYKLETLKIVLAKSTTIDDGEYETVLLGIPGDPDNRQINDLWSEYLEKEHGLTGHVNDTTYEYLLSQGFTGATDDMWYLFWKELTGFEPVPRVIYEFEMPGGTIENYQFDSFGDYQLQLPVI